MWLLKYWATFIYPVFIAIGVASGQTVDKFGVIGGEVSFGPASFTPVSSIVWKHSSRGGVVKAIEWDEDGFSIPNPRFKDITTLDEKTGQITITKLTSEHSGYYTIDINSKEQGQRFKLEVLPPVPKPEIIIDRIEGVSDTVYIECRYNETIIWRNSAGETLEGSSIHPKGESHTVKKTGNPETFYTCTLKNTVSESTSDPVYERDLFQSSSDSGPWWIALIVIALIPIIFALLYKFCDSFHELVFNSCGEKPCIGGILKYLDGEKKNGNAKKTEQGQGNCLDENKKDGKEQTGEDADDKDKETTTFKVEEDK